MTRPARVAVTTPWFPSLHAPRAGAFVADHARISAQLADQVQVLHHDEWPSSSSRERPDFDAVLPLLPRQGPVVRVPVFTVGGASVPARAEAAVRDVGTALGRLDADLVHGHVGYLGGLVAARLATGRVLVTEHSTGLRALLADPHGKDLYAEVLERADRLLCVSDVLRRQVLDVLPAFADKVSVLPNPVDFSRIRRRGPLSGLSRWVFVGGLHERKGVVRLVEAFCLVAPSDPALRLTMYGDGPLSAQLVEIARAAGVLDRLDLRGAVPHSLVLDELAEHDVLFAPSTFETFHLAVPEAVGAGLAVVVTRSGGPEEALAGVEDAVGVFVDVGDDPTVLVEAWRSLDPARLDLDSARTVLKGRYGTAAVTARLSELYDGEPGPGASSPAPEQPERLVVLAASGTRRYAVGPILSAAKDRGIPTTVVTGDAQIASLAGGLGHPVLDACSVAGGPLRGSWRRRLGALRQRLRADRRELTDVELAGATLLVTDVASMRQARRLLAQEPGLRPAIALEVTP